MGARLRTFLRCGGNTLFIAVLPAIVSQAAAPNSPPAAGATAHVQAEDMANLMPRANPATLSDLFSAASQGLDQPYDQYTAFKNLVQDATNIQFAMPLSVFWQVGAPNGGPSTAELLYSPVVSWTPFKDTAIGSGTFTFALLANQFWTGADTASQRSRMGLLVAPNAWGKNNYQYTQLMYTQTFPGNRLAVSVGQYSFTDYDGNEYAGNSQTNFLNYALSQNGTQAYSNAGLGAYTEVSPTPHVHFVAGIQDATSVFGNTLTTAGYSNGQIAWFGDAQWTPDILAGGSYGILYYSQPPVPLQPTASQGISFSASQNLDARFGIFLRVSNASGAAIPITTSIGFGGIVNDPFGSNRPDQAGLGFAWNKVNQAEVGNTNRHAEQASEVYYAVAVSKGLQITPDVQVTLKPVLAPSTTIATVFSIRMTFNF